MKLNTYSAHFIGSRSFHLKIAITVDLRPNQIFVYLRVIFISLQFPVIITLRGVITFCSVA